LKTRRPGLERRPTERLHPLAERIERLSTQTFLRAMHAEDLHAVRAVGRALPDLEKAAEAATASLRAGGRLIYVGAGTSGRLAALDAAECPPTFGVSPSRVVALIAGGRRALDRAVEGAEDDAAAGARALVRLRPTPRDTVIGLTASGDTPFVAGALVAARRARTATVLICGAVPPSSRLLAGVVVRLDTGPELVQGSTRLKAGTAAKLALNMISTRAMAASGKVLRGRMVELRPTSEKLRQRSTRIVMELGDLSHSRAEALVSRGGSVKTALAMAALGVDRRQALAALKAAGGDLGLILKGGKFRRAPKRR
jgi:N-acetylmuramic acid 6-phosphate etherase